MDNGAIFFGILIMLSPLIIVVLFAVGAAVFGVVFLFGGTLTVAIDRAVSRVRQNLPEQAAPAKTCADDALEIFSEVVTPRR